MQIIILSIFLLFFLGGCETYDEKYVPREFINKVQSRFDYNSKQLEIKAQAGEITWVQAQSQIRDMDKGVKGKLDSSGASHTWRYDSGDDEYYAHCIALAEKLDKKEITFAQFDAERKTVFNQVEARRQSLQNQHELIENSRPRQQKCVTEKVLDGYETKCN